MASRPQPEEFSDRELSFGYWIARHRVFLHRFYLAWWFLFAGGSVVLFLLTLTNWLAHRAQTDQIWRSFPTNVINVHVIPSPAMIVITRSDVVAHDDGNIDVLFIVENPNNEWAARALPYEIFVGGASVGGATISLSPMEQKAIIKSQLPVSGGQLPVVRLVLDEKKMQWQHLSINDPALPVVSFETVTMPVRAVTSNQANNPFHSEMEMTLRNKSVFGFREVQVVVRLEESDGKTVALASTYLDELPSLAEKELVFRWPARLSPALTPIIIVNVDRLNESNIIR